MSWRQLFGLVGLVSAFVGVAHAQMPPVHQEAVYSATYQRKFYTGLRKDLRKKATPASREFLGADVKLPAEFDLRERAPAPPIYDQKQCGSCVYNSVARNLWYSYLLAGIQLPNPSRQYLMDCAAEWSCSGSFFEKVAQGLLTKGGTATEAAYPYRAQDQACKGASELIGKIENWKIIDNSPKSIMAALYAGHPVSVTVGADNAFSNYPGGRYTSCTNAGTNHEVLLTGWKAKEAAGSDGFLQFDAQGKLPAGVGSWNMDNSWGTQWGDQGSMLIAITSKTGRLCNNIAEEAGILEIAAKPTPVDGGWSAWSECKDGKQSRTCTNPEPQFGGKACEGPAVQACGGPAPTPSDFDWKSVGVIVAVLVGLAALVLSLRGK